MLYIIFIFFVNLIFVAAKIWGVLDWSWFYVLLPISAIFVLDMTGRIILHYQSRGLKKNANKLLELLTKLKLQDKRLRGLTGDEGVNRAGRH